MTFCRRLFVSLLSCLVAGHTYYICAQSSVSSSDSVGVSPSVSEQPFQSSLRRVQALTLSLLRSADAPAFSYALPQWQQASGDLLSQVPDSVLTQWAPAGLQRVDLPTQTLWCGLWQRANRVRLVWMACRPDVDERRIAAFADQFLCPDTTLTIRGTADGRLSVVDAKGDERYAIPNVLCRLCFSTLTNLKFSAEAKERDEGLLRKCVKTNSALLTDPFVSGWPEAQVCDDPDGNVRMVTYLVANKDFSSHCGGWLVRFGRKGKLTVNALNDASDKIGQPEQAVLNCNKWYGAVYTAMIPFSMGHNQCYVLVGFKGADVSVKRRVLDVLSINGNSVSFGAKAFVHPTATYRRRIFTYSNQASMQIFQDPESGMIVMDHLEPSDRLMVGQFAYYGPDLSYDAYKLDGDAWVFQSDIQVTVEKGAKPNKSGATMSELAESIQPADQRRAGTSIGWGAADRQSGKKASQTRSNKSSRSSGSSYNSRQSRSSSSSNSRGNAWFNKGKGNSSPVGR